MRKLMKISGSYISILCTSNVTKVESAPTVRTTHAIRSNKLHVLATPFTTRSSKAQTELYRYVARIQKQTGINLQTSNFANAFTQAAFREVNKRTFSNKIYYLRRFPAQGNKTGKFENTSILPRWPIFSMLQNSYLSWTAIRIRIGV